MEKVEKARQEKTHPSVSLEDCFQEPPWCPNHLVIKALREREEDILSRLFSYPLQCKCGVNGCHAVQLRRKWQGEVCTGSQQVQLLSFFQIVSNHALLIRR